MKKKIIENIKTIFYALIIALIIGLSVGLTGIARPEGKTDLAGRLFGIGTYALPPFWAAMLIQILFFVSHLIFGSGQAGK